MNTVSELPQGGIASGQMAFALGNQTLHIYINETATWMQVEMCNCEDALARKRRDAGSFDSEEKEDDRALDKQIHQKTTLSQRPGDTTLTRLWDKVMGFLGASTDNTSTSEATASSDQDVGKLSPELLKS